MEDAVEETDLVDVVAEISVAAITAAILTYVTATLATTVAEAEVLMDLTDAMVEMIDAEGGEMRRDAGVVIGQAEGIVLGLLETSLFKRIRKEGILETTRG